MDNPGVRDRRWAIGIRTNRYLYVDLATGEEELYDMHRDPDQYRNLAGRAAYADVRDMLREQLRKVRACDGACAARLCRPSCRPRRGEGLLRGAVGASRHAPSVRRPAQ